MAQILSKFCIIGLVFALSACTINPNGNFRKSANNKLIDSKGLHGDKRPPLYNKKYIQKAKKNSISNIYDDDVELMNDDSEQENIALANREMYREMVRGELALSDQPRRSNLVMHPRTNQASHISDHKSANNEEIRQELEEIKHMLKVTQSDLSKVSCPSAEDLEAEALKRRKLISKDVVEANTKDEHNKGNIFSSRSEQNQANFTKIDNIQVDEDDDEVISVSSS